MSLVPCIEKALNKCPQCWTATTNQEGSAVGRNTILGSLIWISECMVISLSMVHKYSHYVRKRHFNSPLKRKSESYSILKNLKELSEASGMGKRNKVSLAKGTARCMLGWRAGATSEEPYPLKRT